MSQSENFEPANFTSETSGNSLDLPIQPDVESSTEAHMVSANYAGEAQTSADDEIATEACSDALVGLVGKTSNDPGAAFAPDAVACLVALKKNDRPAFEVLRAQLKEAGCRVTALDEAIAEESGESSERAMKQADILVGLAEEAELFHAPDGTSYADLDINGHRETWPVKSKGFRRWIARRYYQVEQGAPSSVALHSALCVIEARAHYDAPERVVYLRVGGTNGRLYLDLCDETWRAVEIDAAGWRIIDSPPVRFRRAAGMQPLPVPLSGGSVETLRSFLNVKTNTDFVLVVAWALAALRNCGPYPVIVLSGEQGSAKSTFSAVLRSLLDPNSAPLRALPREDRDLFIAANNGHILAFDNVSGLPGWISDTLCRLATGGGFAVRQLYSDQDETLFDAERPVILNGIEDFVTRPDLADRAVFLALEPIKEEQRQSEGELWTAFESERPRILGVLLDAVVNGLNRLADTRLEKLPRMADFALWATACESAFWPAGTFEAAYRTNREEAVDSVIDADPIASTIRTMMVGRSNWAGTASDLLVVLARAAGERISKSKSWPETPRALAGRLRRAVTFLRKIGIEVTFSREGQTRTRMIHVIRTDAASEVADVGIRSSAQAASCTSVTSVVTSDQNVVTPLQALSDAADGLADDQRLSTGWTARADALKNGSAAIPYVADANLSWSKTEAIPHGFQIGRSLDAKSKRNDPDQTDINTGTI